MRRGCISLGEIKCDSCGKVVPSAQRYLAMEDEAGKGKIVRYCVDCCVEKKLARVREEKGEKVLTFFPEKEA